MPRATFERLLDTNIGFNRFLLMQLNERLAQFIALVERERLLEPDARVARSLAALFNPVLYPDQEKDCSSRRKSWVTSRGSHDSA
jgi:CRP-like cAMP-binding protein